MNDIKNSKTARRLLSLAASGILAVSALASVAGAQTTAPTMPGQMQQGQMQQGPRTLMVRYYDADPRRGGKLISTASVRVGRPANAPAAGQGPTPNAGATANGAQPGAGRIEDSRGAATAPATSAQRATDAPGQMQPGMMMGGRMGVGRAILAAAPQGAHYARYTNRAGQNVYLNLDALRRMPAPTPGR